MVNNLVPMVVTSSGRGERAYDIFSLLLSERVIILGTEVNAQTANLIVAQLLFLNSQDSTRPIQMYIQSPGGEVYAGLAMYDTMRQLSAPVSTYAVGLTASFGTVVLTAGTKGMRYALPNATIHMHQPWGGAQGQTSDIVIQANEANRLKNRLLEIFADATGKPIEVLERDMDRDIYLSARQAVEYGLVDEVLKENEAAKARLNEHTNGNGHR